MWTFIGVVLIVAGIILIYGVLVKKFPQLKLIDLSTLAKERHAEVKSRIMKDRFDRSLGQIQNKTNTAAAVASSKVKRWYERAYGSLKKMEARIDGGKKPLAAARAQTLQRLPDVMDEAEQARVDGRYEEAERLYIETLKADPKNVEAYRGLAEVFIGQKLYDQAAETLEFLLRLRSSDDRAFGRLGQVEASRGNFQEAENRYLRSIELAPNDASHRLELGRVYLAAGEARKSYEQFRTALQAEPHNPKCLDYFLEASILVGDTAAAREAYGALKEVNPENAKLGDFLARIEALSEKA